MINPEILAIHQGACLILAKHMDRDMAGLLSKDTPWDEFRRDAVIESIMLLRLSAELRDCKITQL